MGVENPKTIEIDFSSGYYPALTITDSATILGVNRKLIYKLIKKGLINPHESEYKKGIPINYLPEIILVDKIRKEMGGKRGWVEYAHDPLKRYRALQSDEVRSSKKWKIISEQLLNEGLNLEEYGLGVVKDEIQDSS